MLELEAGLDPVVQVVSALTKCHSEVVNEAHGREESMRVLIVCVCERIIRTTANIAQSRVSLGKAENMLTER